MKQAPLLIIGPFPPPVHGLAVITAAVTDQLEKDRQVQTLNTAVSDKFPKVAYHVVRALIALYACMVIVFWRLRGRKTVYIVLNDGFGLFYNLASFATARLLGARLFLHHHSFRYIHHQNKVIQLLSRWGRGKTHHIFLCDTMHTKFAALYGDVLGSTLENAAFVPDQTTGTPRTGPYTVGMLSNLTEDKGLYEFLELVQSSALADQDIRFILAGSAADTKDAQAIKDTKAELKDRFTHLGSVFGPQKDAFYQSLDLFVFPTKYVTEAQPTVVFEAQSFGLPVISRPMGCIASQLGQHDTLLNSTDDTFVSEAAQSIQKRLSKDRTEYTASIAAAFAARKSKAQRALKNLFEEM